ncbi:MAG: flagellar biosynthesis protein FlgA [SAR116 cluster bacterium]|nr:flagellar biosynthesis protein FlgA [SAR116 cluster bacterium]RPH09797.1 MAG: flagellar biosynthesis protein FlgA [Alphaproteobacteria bacterium TMED54]
MKKTDAIILNKIDNVATSLREINSNEKITLKIEGHFINFTLEDSIKIFHKFSLKIIKKGDKILKYGEVIGIATKDIKKGKHVHVENITSSRN